MVNCISKECQSLENNRLDTKEMSLDRWHVRFKSRSTPPLYGSMVRHVCVEGGVLGGEKYRHNPGSSDPASQFY